MSRADYLRPSGFHFLMAGCVGYLEMCVRFPEHPAEESDTEVREDGTAAHWLASELYLGRSYPVGTISPNKRIITKEMVEAAQAYVEHITKRTPHVVPVVEQRVDCSVIYPGMGGTPDCFAFDPVSYTLYVDDFKFGFRYVDAWRNWQLLCYAFALIVLLNLDVSRLRIVFTIHQPRCFGQRPVREWSTDYATIYRYLEPIQSAAREAMQSIPRYVTNDHCGDCPGRHACPALRSAGTIAVERSGIGSPHVLHHNDAGMFLTLIKRSIKQLEDLESGLLMQIEEDMRKGKSVIGWELKPEVGRERWIAGKEVEVIGLGLLFGKQLQAPVEPISPTQAKKLIPANMVEMYTERPNRGMVPRQVKATAIEKVLSQ